MEQLRWLCIVQNGGLVSIRGRMYTYDFCIIICELFHPQTQAVPYIMCSRYIQLVWLHINAFSLRQNTYTTRSQTCSLCTCAFADQIFNVARATVTSPRCYGVTFGRSAGITFFSRTTVVQCLGWISRWRTPSLYWTNLPTAQISIASTSMEKSPEINWPSAGVLLQCTKALYKKRDFKSRSKQSKEDYRVMLGLLKLILCHSLLAFYLIWKRFRKYFGKHMFGPSSITKTFFLWLDWQLILRSAYHWFRNGWQQAMRMITCKIRTSILVLWFAHVLCAYYIHPTHLGQDCGYCTWPMLPP